MELIGLDLVIRFFQVVDMELLGMEQFGLLLEMEQIALRIHIMELIGLDLEIQFFQVVDMESLGME